MKKLSAWYGSKIMRQIAYLVVLKAWRSDIFAAITGLICTITGLFVGAKT